MRIKAQILYSRDLWSVIVYAFDLAANEPDYSLPLVQIPAKSFDHAGRIADAINDDFAESNRGKFDK